MLACPEDFVIEWDCTRRHGGRSEVHASQGRSMHNGICSIKVPTYTLCMAMFSESRKENAISK
eukprot:3982129-Pleurochrysis_carterae.AAC.4